MITISFKAWPPFHADLDESVIQRYLQEVAKQSKLAWTRGVVGYHGGRIYQFNGGQYQASAAGEYPARRTGALYQSFQSRISGFEVEISVSAPYAGFLVTGTSKMGKRKMMKEALQEGIAKAQGRLGKWVSWKPGNG